MPEIVGYCRVSTDGQTLDAQVAELKAAGATKLFADRAAPGLTGRNCARRSLLSARATCSWSPGSTAWRAQPATCSTCCTRSRRAARRSKSFHDHWADTTTPRGRLMLTILGGLAEFERVKRASASAGRRS
jgi:DNA invertase Pin-like site-specific DNA recombinase